MSFLSRIFGYPSKEERKGISLAGKPCWEISRVRDAPSFLRAIAVLIPLDSVLYLEDGATPKKLRKYLEERAAKNTCKVEMGTLSLRVDRFHMQATKENLEDLAKLAESYATPEVAIHLHIYQNGRMFLQWYDAFFDPLYISKEIPEAYIKEFCNKLGVDYKETTVN